MCPPPPSTLCTPRLRSTCHNIVNLYVQIWQVNRGGGGGANNMNPLSWGHKRKRSAKKTSTIIYRAIKRNTLTIAVTISIAHCRRSINLRCQEVCRLWKFHPLRAVVCFQWLHFTGLAGLLSFWKRSEMRREGVVINVKSIKTRLVKPGLRCPQPDWPLSFSSLVTLECLILLRSMLASSETVSVKKIGTFTQLLNFSYSANMPSIPLLAGLLCVAIWIHLSILVHAGFHQRGLQWKHDAMQSVLSVVLSVQKKSLSI